MANVREERIKTYSDSLRRFAKWFNRFRKSDGSLDAPNLFCPAYIPVPVCAHATGDTDLLHHTLAYIEAPPSGMSTCYGHPARDCFRIEWRGSRWARCCATERRGLRTHWLQTVKDMTALDPK